VNPFKTLDQLEAADSARVGGKAYNCARLRQAGFPVPDGLVVPTDSTGTQIRSLAADSWFDALPMGSLFAVRSSGLGEDSAGHSFAGIHDTRLNVNREGIVDAVLLCRQSAQSAQARAYREARHLGEDAARIGVLVQRMVPAIASGVAASERSYRGASKSASNIAKGGQAFSPLAEG
jgi:pyruvate,water dikinase